MYRGEFKDNMRDGYGVYQSTPQFSVTWSLTDKIPYAVVQSLRAGSYFNSFSSGFENNLINRLFSDSSDNGTYILYILATYVVCVYSSFPYHPMYRSRISK